MLSRPRPIRLHTSTASSWRPSSPLNAHSWFSRRIAQGWPAGRYTDPAEARAAKPRARSALLPADASGTRLMNVWVSRMRLVMAESTARRITPFSSNAASGRCFARSEEHTSELQSQSNLVCRLLLEKKKNGQLETGSYVYYALPSAAEVLMF